MTKYTNLIDIILTNRTIDKKGITFISSDKDEKFVPYSELYAKVLKYLYLLQSKGIKKGEELIFQIDNNENFIYTFWACILGGIIPVPVTVGNNEEHRLKLFKIWDILKSPYLITNKKVLSSLEKFAYSKDYYEKFDYIRERSLLLESFNNIEELGKVESVSSQDIAFIQFSSGSTGDPKGVILTHENLLVNINALAIGGEISSDDTFINWMPLTHDMGLIALHLLPLYMGINLYIMPTSLFIRRPTLWLKKASEYKATVLASPNFGYKYFLNFFKPEIAEDWDLSHVRLIYNGAEPISVQLCREFLRTMAKHGLEETSMYTVYGLAEATVGVAVPPPGEKFKCYNLDRRFLNIGEPVRYVSEEDENCVTFVGEGYPIKDCFMRICDDSNSVLEDEKIGYIQISGKNVTSGYYNNFEATRKVKTEDGWLITGDLGFMINGRVVITGRSKDIIFVNGQNYYPHDLEMIAEEIDGVELGGIAACGVFNKITQKEEIVVFVLFKGNIAEFVSLAVDAKKYLNRKIGLEIKDVVPIRKMPKTTSGKIQRYRLGDMYQRGQFDETIFELNRLIEDFVSKKVEDEPETETEKRLIEIWKEVLDVESVGIEQSFFQLGGNSLKATILASKIHKEFYTEIPLNEIFDYMTVRAQGKYIDDSEKVIHYSIEPTNEREYYPVSSAQKRMYILNELEGANTSYNVPLLLEIKGTINRDKLECAFKQLIKRHETLRTSFEFIDGEAVQMVHKNIEFNIEYIEASDEDLPDLIKGFIRIFDLSKAPLLRVSIISLLSGRTMMLFDIHHIISDGTSIKTLFKELLHFYDGRVLQQPRIQYKDYSVWQNKILESGVLNKQKKFWVETYDREIPVLNMPIDFARLEKRTFEGNVIRFDISEELSSDINEIARKYNVTLYTVLITAYFVLLNKYTRQKDIIVGSVVAARRHTDLDGLVGMFANFLPIRSSKIEDNSILHEFLMNVNNSVIDATDNQDFPFDKVVESLDIRIDRSRNPLFDTVLILHNELEKSLEFKSEEIELHEYELDRKTSKLDFKLDIHTGKCGELNCLLEYNVNLYKEETMRTLAEHFIRVLELFTEDMERRISDVDILTSIQQEEFKKRYSLNNSEEEALNVVISSSFTAEPIGDYIKWWYKEFFNEKLSLEFAPYNQVFQQLFDSNSIVSMNQGINLILVRFEDWIRDDKSSDNEKLFNLRKNFEELKEAVANRKGNARYLFGIFPVSSHLKLNSRISACIEELNIQWTRFLGGLDKIQIIDFGQLADLYCIEEVFDSMKDIEGHMPFSDQYYAAIGTYVARRICSWKSSQFKVVVVDCDNTLWKGVCGEDGYEGVRVEEPYEELQKLLIDLFNKGILLAICSKNNEEDVWRVFEENKQMLVGRNHFVTYRINWRNKCDNIDEIAKELNLGLDSFIFVDDDPVECLRMMEEKPEVLTLKIPSEPELIPLFLRHVWAFDRYEITEEDKIRTNMYVGERERRSLMEQVNSLDEFIKSLELRICMRHVDDIDFTRAAQLTQRTNQFNLSTKRLTTEQLRMVVSMPGVSCFTIRVKDRFGNYGMVGLVITRQDNEKLILDTFLLSCRVLGRGVESAVMARLKKYCIENRVKVIEAKFIPTDKNKPFLKYMEMEPWEKEQDTSDYSLFKLDVSKLPDDIEYAEFLSELDKEEEKAVNKKVETMIYELDHIAVAVRDIDEAIENFRQIGYECSETVFDPLQNSKLSMCSKDGCYSIELVAPVDSKSPTFAMLESYGERPYHLCYRVNDIDNFIKVLSDNFVEYEIITEKKSAILFGSMNVMFVMIKGLGLIELLEVGNSFKSLKDRALLNNIVRCAVSEVNNPLKFFSILGYSIKNNYLECSSKSIDITIEKHEEGIIELTGLDNYVDVKCKPSFSNILGPYEICIESSQAYMYESCIGEDKLQCKDLCDEKHFRYGELSTCKRIIRSKEFKYLLFYKKTSGIQKNKEILWNIDPCTLKSLYHRCYLVPLKYFYGESLMKLPVYELKEGSFENFEYAEPKDELERTLVEIWEDILGVKNIGINDDFFKLGGHSLKATSLVSKIHKAFGVQVSLTQVFDTPTIKGISQNIREVKQHIFSSIKPAAKQEYYHLSSAQKRMYLIEQLSDNKNKYNGVGVVLIDGKVDKNRFEDAFRDLVKRHEALRTSFDFVDDQPVQRISEYVQFFVDFEECDQSKLIDVVNRFLKPFDLSAAPLIRIKLLKFSDEQYAFIYNIHHIIADGTSAAILVRELANLYDKKELPAIKIQYKDYSEWQKELNKSEFLKQQEEYWLDVFKDKIPELNMPLDYSRASDQTFEGDRIKFECPKELSDALKDLAYETGTTLYMIFAAAFNILLSRYSCQEDIVIGTPVAGRLHADLDNTIGMFANTIALRNYPSGYKTFDEFIKEVKSNTLKAFENQAYQFDELVGKLNIQRDASRNPLFDVMFAFQNIDMPELKTEDLRFSQYDYNDRMAAFDLFLEAIEEDDAIKCKLEYRVKLYKSDTIANMIDDYLRILSVITCNKNIKIEQIELNSGIQVLDEVMISDVEFNF